MNQKSLYERLGGYDGITAPVLAEEGLPIRPALSFSQDRYNLFGFESFPRHCLKLLSGSETSPRIGLNPWGTVISATASPIQAGGI